MKKVLLTALTTTLLVSTAQAQLFTGPYAGLNLGYALNKLKIEDNNSKVTPKGFILGAHLGYGYQFENNFYLGGEVNFHHQFGKGKEVKKLSEDKKVVVSATQYRFTPSMEFAARLGYVMDQVMPYIRLGIATQGIEKKLKTSDGSKVIEKNHDRFFAFVPGIGVDFCLAADNKLRMRAEVTHSIAKLKNIKASTKETSKFNETKFLVGVSYCF